MDQQSPSNQPQTITLNNQNAVLILLQYVEVAQRAGAFLLQESDILKRCRDFFTGASDPELDVSKARTLLIQAVNKGQSKGAYNLDDASVLHRVCQFVQQNLDAEFQPLQVQSPAEQQTVQSESVQPQPVQSSTQQAQSQDDLSSLSEPVPLRSPRVV